MASATPAPLRPKMWPMRIHGNQMDYEAVRPLYTRSLALIKTALGKFCTQAWTAKAARRAGLHRIDRRCRGRHARAGGPHARHLREHRLMPTRLPRPPGAIPIGA